MKAMFVCLFAIISFSLFAEWHLDTVANFTISPLITYDGLLPCNRIAPDSSLQFFSLRIEGVYIPTLIYPDLVLRRQTIDINGNSVVETLASTEIPDDYWEWAATKIYTYNNCVYISSDTDSGIVVFKIPDNGDISIHRLAPSTSFNFHNVFPYFFRGDLYIGFNGLYRWVLDTNTVEELTACPFEQFGLSNFNDEFMLVSHYHSDISAFEYFLMNADREFYPQLPLNSYLSLKGAVKISQDTFYAGFDHHFYGMSWDWDWGVLRKNGNTVNFSPVITGYGGVEFPSVYGQMTPKPQVLFDNNKFIGILDNLPPEIQHFRGYQVTPDTFGTIPIPAFIQSVTPIWARKLSEDKALLCYDYTHFMVYDLANQNYYIVPDTISWTLDYSTLGSGFNIYTRVEPYWQWRVCRVSEYTSVEDELEIPVSNFVLYPNPAGSNCNVRFNLKQASQVSLKVFNCKGQAVWSAPNRLLSKGQNDFALDFLSSGMASLASGMYFVNIEVSGKSYTKKLILLR